MDHKKGHSFPLPLLSQFLFSRNQEFNISSDRDAEVKGAVSENSISTAFDYADHDLGKTHSHKALFFLGKGRGWGGRIPGKAREKLQII